MERLNEITGDGLEYAKRARNMDGVVLRAYLDESELSKAQVFGVGGYVWDEEGANKCEAAWREALADLGLKRFHMNDFGSLWGEFKEWPEEKRVAVLQRLHDIINATILFGYWVTLDLPACEALTEEEKRWSLDPYKMCAITFLARVAAHLNDTGHNVAKKVAYTLDRIDTGHGALKEVFDGLSQDSDWDAYRLGSITWARSVDVPLLQAADVIVYEMAKRSRLNLGGVRSNSASHF